MPKTPRRKPSTRSAAKKPRATPWQRPDPKPAAKRKRLTPAQKTRARSRAKRAGRPYPNLVDNMAVARKAKRAATSTRAAPKRSATRKRSAGPKRAAHTKRPSAGKRSSGRRSAELHDPHGGLTAAGREHFRRTEGAHLKPGVRKREAVMTPAEMKRKGSWAARFYGRKVLPPLVDAHGKPTRFALTAAAWGEPVPRTEAAARRIAAKGRRLLERAKASGG